MTWGLFEGMIKRHIRIVWLLFMFKNQDYHHPWPFSLTIRKFRPMRIKKMMPNFGVLPLSMVLLETRVIFFFYSKSLKTRVVTKQNFFLSLLNYRNVDLVYTCLSSNACFAIIVLVQIFVWTVNTYKIRIKLLEWCWLKS